MRKLNLTHDALKFLKALDAKQFKQVVGKLFDLMKDPAPSDSRTLSGYDGRRADVGEFRVVYRFDSDSLFIDLIGKRNDDEVSRRLRR